MAKKNLINADMLLATPRKTYEPIEPTLSVAKEPFLVTTLEIIDLPDTFVESAPTPPAAVSSVKRGLKGSETRATFIVDESLVEKLKAVAYWERLNIKEVINEAFQNYITHFENHNGTIQPVPTHRKGA